VHADCAEGDLCEVKQAMPATPGDPVNNCVDTSAEMPMLTECETALAAVADVEAQLAALTVDQNEGVVKLKRNKEQTINLPPGDQVVLGLDLVRLGVGSKLRLVAGQPGQTLVIKVAGRLKIGRGVTVEMVGLEAEKVLWALGGKGRVSIEFNSFVQGTFWGPERMVKLGRYAELEGAIVAERIKTKVDSTVTHTPFTAFVQ
jgi:hypothetical protein